MRKIKQNFSLLFALLTLAMAGMMVLSCKQDNTIYVNGGDNLGGSDVYSTTITVRGEKSVGDKIPVVLTRGEGSTTENILAYATADLPLTETVLLNVNEDLVDTYNSENGTSLQLLPSEFYSFPNGGVMTLEDASTITNPVIIYETNALGNTLEAGSYLLPIEVIASAAKVSNKVLYVGVVIREKYEGFAELYEGDELFCVFYVNTNEYDPRIVTDYCMSKMDMMTFTQEWYCTLGNILNLRVSTIGYDKSSGRAVFSPNRDLYYVLNNYDTYILPLQETGRKICISIEGNGSGLGFCNLTDAQISDFVSQVKTLFETYPLDGINLWDRSSGYGAEGMPAMNTTSYPKLIKALREALGDDKLLTVTDYEEPTEYFWDTEATGGIAVGDYIDYAWSGYNKNRLEYYQIVDPYHQGEATVSTLYPRKPIAGLDASRYGCINAPWQYVPKGYVEVVDASIENLILWSDSGLKQNNIMVFEDLRTNLQDVMETTWYISLMEVPSCFVQYSALYSFDFIKLTEFSDGYSGFNKWLKNW